MKYRPISYNKNQEIALDILENVGIDTEKEALFPPTHGELMQIWQSPLWGALMLCLFDTGARPGELRQKKWSGYYPEDRYMPFSKAIEGGTATHEKGTKTGTISHGYLTTRAAQELEIWRSQTRFCKPDDYIFTRDGKAPVIDAAIEQAFKKALQFLGYDSQGWTPYYLRHTFITFAAEELSDAELQMLVGHTNLQTNKGYRHMTDQTMLRRTKHIRDKLDELRGDK